MDKINDCKFEIVKYLNSFFEDFIKQFPAAQKHNLHILHNLQKLSVKGKTIRGAILIQTHHLLNGKHKIQAIQAAAALELFHTSFLIHDDIIDNDRLRRGGQSIFALYEKQAIENNFRYPQNFGKSLAICSADIGFFLGFLIISKLKLSHNLKSDILSIFSHELINVGIGEIDDIELNQDYHLVGKEKILEMYRYKTSRYTFSLPLKIGAALANAPTGTINKLDKIGENLGIAYQISDDALGIYGEPDKTGKSVGNDIREGKKTLYYYYLFSRADNKIKKKLHKIFGNPKINTIDFAYVKQQIKVLGIETLVEADLRYFINKSKSLINMLGVDITFKNFAHHLCLATIKRDH